MKKYYSVFYAIQTFPVYISRKSTGNFRSIILLIILVFAQMARPQKSTNVDTIQWDSILVDSIHRSYAYYVPEGLKPDPKLIFVLHGSTMTSEQMIVITGNQFNSLTDEGKNAIIVYPQGYKNHWNDCRDSGTYEANLLDMNDGKFFEKIIKELGGRYNIGKRNVFVIGYSNGGQLCFKLAKEQPGMFRGYATIGANLPLDSNNCYSENVPVSMMIINGTKDPINPYEGGSVIVGSEENYGDVMSTKATVQYWANLMRCNDLIETITDLPNLSKTDNSTVSRMDYFCEASNKMVSHVEIINGGHTIPNPRFTSWPKYLGHVNGDINLPEIILDYFHSLK